MPTGLIYTNRALQGPDGPARVVCLDVLVKPQAIKAESALGLIPGDTVRERVIHLVHRTLNLNPNPNPIPNPNPNPNPNQVRERVIHLVYRSLFATSYVLSSLSASLAAVYFSLGAILCLPSDSSAAG